MSQNEYYQSHQDRLNTVVGLSNRKFFAVIRKIQEQWVPDHPGQKTQDFLLYLEEVYGIQMCLNKEGQVLPEWQVIDQQKHLLFVLKWGL